MKKVILLICLITGLSSAGFSQTDYTQWEVMSMKPKAGQMEMFRKGLSEHNRKYHTADPYKSSIFEVSTGPNSGEFTWIMGPVTFTQLDNRPANPEHEADWEKNVVPYVESFGEVSYWRTDKDIMYMPEKSDNLQKTRLRFFTLLPGQRDRFEDLLTKIAAVYKAKKYAGSYRVHWRFGASQGPHAVTDLSFEKWGYLDNGSDFEKDFNEVHGDGSFNRLIDEFALCVDRTKTYDELNEFVSELSSK